MGSAASTLKTFYRRLVRRSQQKDRWIREDEQKLLPEDEKSQVSTQRGALPIRIDDQVYNHLQQQDLTRRRPDDDDTGFAMHDEIHHRHMLYLRGKDDPRLSLKSHDSIGSWVRNGTESLGVNFYSLEQEVDEESSSMPVTTTFRDEATARRGYAQVRLARFLNEEAAALAAPLPQDNDPEFSGSDADNNNDTVANDNDVGRVDPEPSDQNDDCAETQNVRNDEENACDNGERYIRRFELVINECNSLDAPWCNNILLS